MSTVARFTNAITAAFLILSFATPIFAWPTAKELSLRRLTKQVQVDFTATPLDKVLQSLGEQADVSITCRTEALHAEGIGHQEPVTLSLATPISLKSALDLIVSHLRLTHVVRGDGRIEIISPADLEVVERMYDVSRLLTGRGNRAARAALGKHGREEAMTFAGLVELLKDTVEPETWAYEGRALAAAENDPYTLVISQSEEVHSYIDDLLAQLHTLTHLRVLTTIDEQSIDSAVVEAFAREQKLAMPLIKLDAAQAEAFCKLKSNKLSRRHYVSFNGETFTTTERLELQAIVHSDDSTIRLMQTSADEPSADAKVDELQSSEMLLLERTDDESAKSGIRRYLTITPKVVRLTDRDSMRFDRAPRRDVSVWGLHREE